MSKGFYHPDRGYWETTSDPSPVILAAYPEGTVEVPLKPGSDYELIDGEWVYSPPPPPTPEEIRAAMPPLSARRFRLGLINAKRSLSEVDAVIAAIPDEAEREAAEVEWLYAKEFERTHPLVVSLSAALGFTPEEVDTLWGKALTL